MRIQPVIIQIMTKTNLIDQHMALHFDLKARNYHAAYKIPFCLLSKNSFHLKLLKKLH